LDVDAAVMPMWLRAGQSSLFSGAANPGHGR